MVDEGVRVFQADQHDSLLSLGGGSPIDTAKAIGMLLSNGGKVREFHPQVRSKRSTIRSRADFRPSPNRQGEA